jgi:hypothetical protein
MRFEACGKRGNWQNVWQNFVISEVPMPCSRLTLTGKFPQANPLADGGHDSFCCAIQWFQC